MSDKIEDLIERLLEVTSVGFVHLGQEGVSDPGVCIEAAEALTALRTQRDDVIEEAAKIADFHDTLPHLPGACGAAIRNLKSAQR